jgi:hypothetical protein
MAFALFALVSAMQMHRSGARWRRRRLLDAYKQTLPPVTPCCGVKCDLTEDDAAVNVD